MSREAILERERRWGTPAAVTAFIAVVLLIGSLISRSGITTSSNSSIQLMSFNDHPGALVFSSILSGLGFAIFAIPLCYLFVAARARNPRLQGALIGLCVLGPVLIGAQGVINGFGLKTASSDFVAQRPAERTIDLKQFRSDLNARPPTISTVNVYSDSNVLEVEYTNGDFKIVHYPRSEETKLIGTDSSSVSSSSEIGRADSVDNSVDTSGKVGDALASHIADDNSTVKLASDLIFPAALAMIFAIVYTALQSYRVGLLTRFFGTLGMALGVSIILLPFAPALIALWLGWLGLIFIDRVPGGRPPAWAAGEAVPWPPAGQRGGARGGDSIEGSASEVGANGGDASNPPRQPGERRKRKRRSGS